MVRFPRDEAARHALVSLIGDLALMAEPGGSGLPVGHVVVFQVGEVGWVLGGGVGGVACGRLHRFGREDPGNPWQPIAVN